MRYYYYKLLSALSMWSKFLFRNRIKVLAFHDVKDTNQFDNLIKFLKHSYNIISIEDLRNSVLGNKNLPINPVLITFDDGDYSVFTKGFPVLKKYDAPACLFIITGLINTQKNFWFYQVRETEKRRGKSNSEINSIVNTLKSVPNKKRINDLQKYGEGKRRQLTSSEIKILQENRIFIGNHSHSHPMFDTCTESEIKEELESSKSWFAGVKGYEVFAYPNGNSDKQTKNLLKLNGIKLAFLFDHKVCKKKLDPLQISRIRVNSDMSLDEFKAKVSGLHPYLFHVQKKWSFLKN